MNDKTKVIFRAWDHKPDRGFNGKVIAVFPDLPAYGDSVTTYEHIGQHGSADYGHLLECTRLATPKEYAELKRELESGPFNYSLTVRKRRGWTR